MLHREPYFVGIRYGIGVSATAWLSNIHDLEQYSLVHRHRACGSIVVQDSACGVFRSKFDRFGIFFECNREFSLLEQSVRRIFEGLDFARERQLRAHVDAAFQRGYLEGSSCGRWTRCCRLAKKATRPNSTVERRRLCRCRNEPQ